MAVSCLKSLQDSNLPIFLKLGFKNFYEITSSEISPKLRMLFLNHEDTLIAIVGTNLLEDLTRLLSEEGTELNKTTIKFIELTVLYFNFF